MDNPNRHYTFLEHYREFITANTTLILSTHSNLAYFSRANG